MIYDTYVRTRFGAFWLLTTLSLSTAALAFIRWHTTGQLRDGLPIIWVIGVVYFTLRILRRLGQLERQRTAPDAAMNLLLETATVLPMIGCTPIFWIVAQ